MLENLGENTCGNYTFVRIEKEWRLGQSYTIRHFHWRSDIFGTVFTSLHWKGLNWEDDGPQNVGSLKCIGDGVQMSFKTVQGEGPVSTCAPWLSWRALCGREWAGRTFWQWRKWRRELLSAERSPLGLFSPHSARRPHRRQGSGLSDSNSWEREGNNSSVDMTCEEEWWRYSLFRDSVPGEKTGLDRWECSGEGERCRRWRGKWGVSSGRMMMSEPPRSMALSPAGESGTIDGSWHPGSCSNSERCATAKQLSALQTASLLGAHPSPSSRPSCIGQDEWENHPGSTGFRYYPLSIVLTSFGLCTLLPPLWTLGQKAPGLTHPSDDMWNMEKRIFSEASGDWVFLQQSKSDRECPCLPGNGQRFIAALIHQKDSIPISEHGVDRTPLKNQNGQI